MGWTHERYLIAANRGYHGLGNRIRVVFGAHALALHTDREFRYVWPLGRHFGASLDDLWEVAARPVPLWWSQALSLRFPYRDETLTWLDRAEGERVWQIRTAHALHLPAGAGPWEAELQRTRPVAAVRERVEDFHRRELAPGPYLGVMVRAHPASHHETLSASPLSWFVERLSEIRRQHPTLRFFVSADTPEAAHELAATVPGCVSLPKVGGYNTREGLQESVADLYLLAGSCHLIGPHFSSFPELAQRLAGPALRLETSRTDVRRAFDPALATVASDPVRPHVRQAASI